MAKCMGDHYDRSISGHENSVPANHARHGAGFYHTGATSKGQDSNTGNAHLNEHRGAAGYGQRSGAPSVSRAKSLTGMHNMRSPNNR